MVSDNSGKIEMSRVISTPTVDTYLREGDFLLPDAILKLNHTALLSFAPRLVRRILITQITNKMLPIEYFNMVYTLIR